MERVAFKMKLKPGFEEEYKKRHDELWPEMAELIKQSGVAQYSIFLDSETNILFGYLQRDTSVPDLQSVEHPVVRKWWKHMADIMEVNEDLSPVVKPLSEVFFLP
ncbi:MAG: L-rhamnose mutarotase [Chitinophagaceae bacterium]|nr:L-rhamnose mutarotase [Chitinophagaceae bacterium]